MMYPSYRVLVACERSGRVRDAFNAVGHRAYSCDLEDTDTPGPHLQMDVTTLLDDTWDIIIAFPPCTYLCNSGVRWLFGGSGDRIDRDRWERMIQAVHLFNRLLRADCPKIAVENPVMHCHARRLLLRDYNQIINPWQFGHGETKKTCLWLKGLKPLKPTRIVPNRAPRVHLESPGPDRHYRRSITLPGIAEAMADQWGHLQEN